MFEADKSLGTYRWPLIRLLPGRRTEIVLLSPRFFEVTTHWTGTTVLCAGEACPLCDLLPSRGLFYIAVLCEGRTSLVELGAQSASNFEQHCKFVHKTMRPGIVLELARKTAKSPVHSECIRFCEEVASVEPLVLAQRVMAVYKFPPPNPSETMMAYDRRCHDISMVRLRRVAADLQRREERPGTRSR